MLVERKKNDTIGLNKIAVLNVKIFEGQIPGKEGQILPYCSS